MDLDLAVAGLETGLKVDDVAKLLLKTPDNTSAHAEYGGAPPNPNPNSNPNGT